MKWLMNWLAKVLKWDNTPIPPNPMPSTDNQPVVAQVSLTAAEKLYQTAKSCLETHQTLNESVGSEKGCAEAVSAVLKLEGYTVPIGGIAGTASLLKWLQGNAAFKRVYAPEKGAIIVSPTGMGNGHIPGHTGIVGGYGVTFTGDYGIMSNDSQTGLFLELWNLTKWGTYYQDYGGLPTYYFLPV